jgi:hypothetical protein
VLSAILLKTAYADEVILNDESRLFGTVVSMESKKLVFNTSFAGDITIKWDQVARLTTDTPMEVSLGDKKIYKGTLIPSDEGTITIKSEDGPDIPPLALADIKTLTSHPKPSSKWAFEGRISLGLSYEEGNTEKDTFNLDGEMQLYKHPYRFDAVFETDLEKAFNVTTKDQSNVRVSFDRFLTKNWYVGALGTFEQDKFSDLSSLWGFFAGPGYQFWESRDDRNLRVGVGLGYVSENYEGPQQNFGGQDNRDYPAGGWDFRFDSWHFNKRIQPFFNNNGIISLEDSSVWRTMIRTGIRFPTIYNVIGSVQYSWDWVNSPADGKKEYDEGIQIKLGYGW